MKPPAGSVDRRLSWQLFPSLTAGDSAAFVEAGCGDRPGRSAWLALRLEQHQLRDEYLGWSPAGPVLFYEYDGTSGEAAGKGRRTAMWDAAGNSSWSYDGYGRVTTTATRVVDGRSYASSYTYDALDRAREMTYPDGEALTYSYQANLLLDGIRSSIGDLDLVSGVVYEDIGLPDQVHAGQQSHDCHSVLRVLEDRRCQSRSPFAALKRIKLSKDSTDLVNREMQYDAVGNVTKIVDGVNSETIDYTYDELNRVLTASVPTGESFAYDTIGNMTSKAGTALELRDYDPEARGQVPRDHHLLLRRER